MTASKLLDWHHAWKLNGNSLCCRRCGSVQNEADGDSDVRHSDTCPAREVSKTPWNELKSLVARDTIVVRDTIH